MSNKINLHLTPTHFHNASRILKITKSISNLNYFDSILIVATGASDTMEHESIDGKRKVWRIPLKTFGLSPNTIRGILRYLQWFITILLTFRKDDRINAINCHTLMDLPIGVLLKRMNSHVQYLIYDPHELETETKNLKGVYRLFAKWIEKTCIYYADYIFVVSPSIEKWYRDTYNLDNVTTIRNVPETKEPYPITVSNKFRERFRIGDNELVFLYQGHLSRGRGISLLIEAFLELESSKHIIFMGYGPLEDEIKTLAEHHPNIHFHEAVKPDDLLTYTASADVGFALIENACLSYYYCLPNKLYEYTLSRIPSITSKFPEMTRFIEEIGAGWTVELNFLNIIGLLRKMDKHVIERHKSKLRQLNMNFSWQVEEKNLLEVYRSLIGKNHM